MEILVREADGYVLNSSALNYAFEYEDQLRNGVREYVYEREYYTKHEVDLTPETDEAIPGFVKVYFYNDGELTCRYSATSEVDDIIKDYEAQLSATDYIVVKAYERALTNQPADTQYDYEEVAASRQALRDKINELRTLKEKYPTIETYREDYMKPIEDIH